MAGTVIPFTAHLPAVEASVEALRAYKSVYALCTVGKDKELKATHYAAVLVGGAAPTWGVWLVNGKFQRFAGSRAQIERAYPKLVWRRKMATWQCTDVENKSVATRRSELEDLYGQRIKA
jgi:hypothetical protein